MRRRRLILAGLILVAGVAITQPHGPETAAGQTPEWPRCPSGGVLEPGQLDRSGDAHRGGPRSDQRASPLSTHLRQRSQTVPPFLRHRPAVINSLKTLAPADPVWLRLSDAASWDQPLAEAGLSRELSPGFNLVTWLGQDGIPVEEAFLGIEDAVLGVFAFDASSQTFDTFGPTRPALRNTLRVLPFGAGIWLQLDANVTWRQASTVAVPSILSDGGELASFENFAPVIREVVIDEDPNSPVVVTIVFQQDDHGLDRLELYGGEAKQGGRPTFGIVHFTGSQTTARIEFDSQGALTAIQLPDAQLNLNFGDGELLLDYEENGRTLAATTVRQGGTATSARLRSAQAGATIEWRNASRSGPAVSVSDRTTTYIFISDPSLAGETVSGIQVFEADPLFNDPIGGPITITFDENGVGAAQFIAAWRADGGAVGGYPEYRCDVPGGASASSAKLYVTPVPRPTVVEIRRGTVFDLRVLGEPLPDALN